MFNRPADLSCQNGSEENLAAANDDLRQFASSFAIRKSVAFAY